MITQQLNFQNLTHPIKHKKERINRRVTGVVNTTFQLSLQSPSLFLLFFSFHLNSIWCFLVVVRVSPMSSIMQSFQRSPSLPLSQTQSKEHPPLPTLRRRLSSLSIKFHPSISSPSAPSWAFPRSKSLSSMGDYAGSSIRKWWDWGCSWFLSRKPMFAQDLEMNEEETKVLGCHNKGSWRHVFYKLRSKIKKLMGSDKVGLPQTCRYDSLSYSKNFGDGNKIYG